MQRAFMNLTDSFTNFIFLLTWINLGHLLPSWNLKDADKELNCKQQQKEVTSDAISGSR